MFFKLCFLLCTLIIHFYFHFFFCKLENKNHNTDDEDCLLFQKSVPVENPLGETQSGNLDFETEVIDYDSGFDENKTTDSICEYGEEMVVLDSEDEESNGSRRVGVPKSLPHNKTKEQTEGQYFYYWLFN